MITVLLDEDTALDMLIDRVTFWNDDQDVVDLFTEYYSDMVYGGAFEDAEFNVMEIVDNDYINNTQYGTLEDIKDMYNDFDEDRILAQHNGLVLYAA